MATRGLVIGVEQYPLLRESADLASKVPGAVADARAFYDWLCSTPGCNRADVFLHLWPVPDDLTAVAQPANADVVRTSLRTLDEVGRGTTERLYVFFSGHGMQAGTGAELDPNDLLVFADFRSARSPDKVIVADHVIRDLRQLGPGAQYFFWDCCRNPAGGPTYCWGSTEVNPEPSGLGRPAQCVLYSVPGGATAPAQRGGSPFAARVLAGLRGHRFVTTWDAHGHALEVHFGDLARDVCALYKPSPWPRTDGPPPLVVATVYPPPPGPVVDLEVRVEPPVPDGQCRVTVSDHRAAHSQPVCDSRAAFQILPGAYMVWLEPTPTGEPALRTSPRPVKVFRAGDRSAVVRWGGVTGVPLRGALESAGLSVEEADRRLADPTGPVEVQFDLPSREAGVRIRRNGQFGVIAVARPAEDAAPTARLTPGEYWADVVENGLTVGSWAFEVSPMVDRRVALEPRVPEEQGLRDLFKAWAAARPLFGWVEPSPELGPIADQSPSLWLSFLAVRAIQPSTALGGDFRLPDLGGTPAGHGAVLFLTFTRRRAETAPAAALWHEDARAYREVSLEPSGRPRYLWTAGVSLEPGRYLIGWDTYRGRRTLPLPVLPERASCVILIDLPSQPPTLRVYLLPLEYLSGPVPPGPERLRLVRDLENAQRRYEAGVGLKSADARYDDPLLPCLALHAALDAGSRDPAAEERFRAAVRPFDDVAHLLPDLAAALRRSVGDQHPVSGVPTLRPGAEALGRDVSDGYALDAGWGMWTLWSGWPGSGPG
ncbi:MAG TPA: caspase family protein [Urbifossiella sp.]|nr:caspase family protein [Urbifossiella sp.]